MRIIGSIILIGGMVACSTSKPDYTAQDIKSEMTPMGKVDDGTYGTNDDGEVIIQEEKDPGAELMIVKRVNQNLFLELERDAFDLNSCIQEFSDPKLGGDGKYKKVDDYESLRPRYESEEKMGMAEDGKLKIVKRQYLAKTLNDANAQTKKLRKMLGYVQGELRKCQTDLRYKKAAKEKS